MNIQEPIQEICARLGRIPYIREADMSRFSSFRAGGPAALLILPENRKQLEEAVKTVIAAGGFPGSGGFDFLSEAGGFEYRAVGNLSNILVRDGGYRGVLIKTAEAVSAVSADEETGRITAEAGALLSKVARAALEAGLAGFEFASGIPGSVGGALFMNAGAYEGEMAGIVLSAEVLDGGPGGKDGGKNRPEDGRVRIRRKEEMELTYRNSLFQRNGEVILSVELQLEKGDRNAIRAEMDRLAAVRREKQPLQFASAGSFFKRPPGRFAGKLIADAGLQGLAVGDAQISELHAGFLINRGNASAGDILRLMKLVQGAVLECSGILLEPEVRILGTEEA